MVGRFHCFLKQVQKIKWLSLQTRCKSIGACLFVACSIFRRSEQISSPRFNWLYEAIHRIVMAIRLFLGLKLECEQLWYDGISFAILDSTLGDHLSVGDSNSSRAIVSHSAPGVAHHDKSERGSTLLKRFRVFLRHGGMLNSEGDLVFGFRLSKPKRSDSLVEKQSNRQHPLEY